jgi:hypothetical protein
MGWVLEYEAGASGKLLDVQDTRSEPKELPLSRGLPVPWNAGVGCGSGFSWSMSFWDTFGLGEPLLLLLH